jgi:hypothetical protein
VQFIVRTGFVAICEACREKISDAPLAHVSGLDTAAPPEDGEPVVYAGLGHASQSGCSSEDASQSCSASEPGCFLSQELEWIIDADLAKQDSDDYTYVSMFEDPPSGDGYDPVVIGNNFMSSRDVVPVPLVYVSAVEADSCAPVDTRAKKRRLRGKGPAAIYTIPRRVSVLHGLLTLMSSFDHYNPEPDLDGVEFFSGVASVVDGFRHYGKTMAAYDVLLNQAHDMTTEVGFMLALEMVCRTKPYGLIHLAPPCSTFVWCNRFTSGRSQTDPEGRVCLEGVALSNLIVVRCILLIMLATSRTV